MKIQAKILAFALLALVPSVRSLAQGSHIIKLSNHLDPYGFIRTAAIFDARESLTDTEDQFYYLPYDKDINFNGEDIYYNPSLKMSAVTTRLGVDITGFKYGSFSVSGKVETDFTLFNGSSPSLRLRQAYLDLGWDKPRSLFRSYSFRVGHAWHPMSEDMPYCVNYEMGSPFNPYSRSPQIMFRTTFLKNFSFTAGALYPSEFCPAGPEGPSVDYVKYGLIPELYAGLSYSVKGFTAKAGADFISLRPRWRTTDTDGKYYDLGTSVEDRISMVSPMVYLEYSKGDLKVNAKAVYASGGDHLGLMGGYAVCDVTRVYEREYSPLRSLTSFASVCYGSQLQFMCMAGYMRAFGSKRMLEVDEETGYLDPDNVYFFSGGFKNIRQMARITPTVAYNLERLTFALEYDFTGVDYGDIDKLDQHALAVEDNHLIINHRVLAVVKYTF